MEERKKINKRQFIKPFNFQLKKYLSEITEKMPIPWDANFKILLGGKSRGKSWLAFYGENGIFDTLKKGGRVCYMRNTEQEAYMQRSFFVAELMKLFPDEKFSASKNGISRKSDGLEIVTFLSSTNYNKISGNVLPYKCLFYDEYNQQLTGKKMAMLMDLILIYSTVFRGESLNVWVCGNTYAASQEISDSIDLPDLPANTFYYYEDETGSTFGLRFNDAFFTEPANAQMALFAKSRAYDSLFLGNSYAQANPLINREINSDVMDFLGCGYVLNGREYALFKDPDAGVYYVDYLPESLRNVVQYGYTDDQEKAILNGWRLMEHRANGAISSQIARRRIFFCDFNSYYNFFDVLKLVKYRTNLTQLN